MKAAQIEDQSAGDTTMRLQIGRTGGGRYEAKHRRQRRHAVRRRSQRRPAEDARGDSIVLIRDVSQRRRDLVAARRAAPERIPASNCSGSPSASMSRRSCARDRSGERPTRQSLAYLYFVDPAAQDITLAAWRDRSQAQATMADAEPRPLARAGLFTDACARAMRRRATI